MATLLEIICVVVALLGSNTIVNGLDTVEVADVRAQIRQMIIDEPIEEGRQANDQAMIAGLVRLAFHDCVGLQCDGCINHANPENAGLQVYIDRAELLFNNLQVNGVPVVMSRADFWALAGIEAVTFAAEKANSPQPNIEFRYGRTSCATSPTTTDQHTFPDSLGDTAHVLQFFQNQFGFDAKETTAILGAHTLGNAHRQNSGFVHPWVPNKHRLDNAFYSELQDSANGWNQRSIRQGGVTRWFWESTTTPQLLMLNTDMCLIKDMSSRDSEGMVTCDYNTCATPSGGTDAWVTTFANDNGLWITEFAAAFEKMIESGWTGQLSLPAVVQVPLPDVTSTRTNNLIQNPEMNSIAGYSRTRQISVVSPGAFEPSFMFSYSPNNRNSGFFQRVRFNGITATDFVASLWSRLETASGAGLSDDYSLQVIIQFVDGSSQTLTEQFDSSETTWHKRVIEFSSTVNIQQVDVWAKTVEIAWFDEMALLADPAWCVSP